MGSEIWFREMELIYNAKLDAGVPDTKAYEQAGNEADGAVRERLADMADLARTRRKDGGK